MGGRKYQVRFSSDCMINRVAENIDMQVLAGLGRNINFLYILTVNSETVDNAAIVVGSIKSNLLYAKFNIFKWGICSKARRSKVRIKLWLRSNSSNGIGSYSRLLNLPRNTSTLSSSPVIPFQLRSTRLMFTTSTNTADPISVMLQCRQLKETTASVSGSCGSSRMGFPENEAIISVPKKLFWNFNLNYIGFVPKIRWLNVWLSNMI